MKRRAIRFLLYDQCSINHLLLVLPSSQCLSSQDFNICLLGISITITPPKMIPFWSLSHSFCFHIILPAVFSLILIRSLDCDCSIILSLLEKLFRSLCFWGVAKNAKEICIIGKINPNDLWFDPIFYFLCSSCLGALNACFV